MKDTTKQYLAGGIDGARDGLGWRTIRYATGWASPTE